MIDPTRPRRRPHALLTALALLGLALLVPPSPAAAQPHGVRILSYNTALLYIRGSFPGPLPGPQCLSSCDPLQPPWPLPCGCQTIGFWVNDNDFTGTEFFSGIDELQRAQLIAERILATDQDVVVLNEVFSDAAKDVFVSALAGSGPYKHYVRKLQGVPPHPDAKLSEYVALDDDFGWVDDFPFFPDIDIEPLDSGLMLFSKHLFLPLTGSWVPNDAVCGSNQCQFDGWNNGAPLPVGHVAFKVYDAANGSDAFASKGVGLVKVLAPGGPSYVAFTHMQADSEFYGGPAPDPDAAAARARQLETIRDVLLGAIPLGELKDDRAVFVAGDLNIAGSQRLDPDKKEWHEAHQPGVAVAASEFFACGNGALVNGVAQPCRFGATGPHAFTDSWGFETSTTDAGRTSGEQRLDYVLHSAKNGSLCMQHATIAWDLQADPDGNGGQHWLSDHRPVRADFNVTARLCSPNDDAAAALAGVKNARELVFGPTDCDDSPSPLNPACHQNEIVQPPDARIRWGGSFQWFVIRQPGTYSMDLDPAVSGADVAYLVYHHTDLSRPIAAFDPAQGEWGVIFSLPHPPYYIRTFAVDAQGQPDRTATNRSYTFKVHQHLCRTPSDGCVLEPGTTPIPSPGPNGNVDPLGVYIWPQTGLNDPLSDVKELWWRFKTSGVKDGRPSPASDAKLPAVRAFLEADDAKDYACLTVKRPVIEEYADPLYGTDFKKAFPFTTVEVDQDKDWDDDTRLPDDRRLAPGLPGDTLGELKIYFVKLTRNTNASTASPCNNSMISSLSYHTNLTFYVPQHADATGELDDDVFADDNLCIHTAFDTASLGDCPASGVDVTFDVPIGQGLHYAALRGYYVQGAFPNFFEKDEHEFLHVWNGGQPFPGLPVLDDWQEFADAQYHHADQTPGDGDYTYLVTYRRCHFQTHPSCLNP
jgi:hypothetical protein